MSVSDVYAKYWTDTSRYVMVEDTGLIFDMFGEALIVIDDSQVNNEIRQNMIRAGSSSVSASDLPKNRVMAAIETILDSGMSPEEVNKFTREVRKVRRLMDDLFAQARSEVDE